MKERGEGSDIPGEEMGQTTQMVSERRRMGRKRHLCAYNETWNERREEGKGMGMERDSEAKNGIMSWSYLRMERRKPFNQVEIIPMLFSMEKNEANVC